MGRRPSPVGGWVILVGLCIARRVGSFFGFSTIPEDGRFTIPVNSFITVTHDAEIVIFVRIIYFVIRLGIYLFRECELSIIG